MCFPGRRWRQPLPAWWGLGPRGAVVGLLGSRRGTPEALSSARRVPWGPCLRAEGRAGLLPDGPRPVPRAGGGPGWQSPAAGVHFLGGAVRRGGGPGGSGSAMDPRGKRARSGGVELCKCQLQGLCAWLGGRGTPAAASLLLPLPRREPRNLAWKPWRRAVSSASPGETSCCRDLAPAGAGLRGLRRRGRGAQLQSRGRLRRI